MDKPIFTAFSPNVEGDDIMRSLLYFFMPWKWRGGEYGARLEKEFRERFGALHAVLFESGRSALYAILKELRLKQGDEVIIQAFTCVAVPNSILWAGGIPLYADIDPHSLNMSVEDFEKKITPRTRAVVVQHTFGLPAPIEKIMEIARSHNLFVIEDCAHALGVTCGGQLLGTFGDAAFFSFGRDKVISSVFGGLAITNNSEIGSRIKAFQVSLSPAGIFWTAKQIIHPALSAFLRSTHCKCAGRIGRVFLKIALTLNIITKTVSGREKRGKKPQWILRKMPNALAAFAWHQLQKLDRINNHRRKVAGRYHVLFPQLCAQPHDPEAIYLRFAIRREDARQLIEKAKRKDIFLGDWYRDAIAPSGVDYKAIQYNPALCPEAERAAEEIINLPTDIHIGEKQIERIVAFIQSQP